MRANQSVTISSLVFIWLSFV